MSENTNANVRVDFQRQCICVQKYGASIQSSLKVAKLMYYTNLQRFRCITFRFLGNFNGMVDNLFFVP